MTITAFLKVPDVPGEVTDSQHEGAIAVHGLAWAVSNRVEGAGTARRRSRAQVENLTAMKYIDAASPHLAVAALIGKLFPEVVLTVRRSGGETAFDYLVITLRNCRIEGVELFHDDHEDLTGLIHEEVELGFEGIAISYVEQADDGSAGDTQEMEYDLRTG